MQREVISVSQLNRYVKSFLSDNPLLNGLIVRGEISNFTRHYKSGHLYLTLKDDQAAVKAVMFRNYADQLPFRPENGMAVIVTGAATLYERDGSYQLYLTDMQPDGVGALHLAFEQLKEKLEREGLFDSARKRALPRYPETIGIVTSEGAAALRDMLSILARRYPMARVMLCPAQVQGAGAAQTLINGLARLNAARTCDVIIIGRGGGSMEDLWAFNDERLARAIAASETPVVSAVGHETDFTIADFAADLRAPTPSAAAELVAPDVQDVSYYLDELAARCAGVLEQKLHRYETRLQSVKERMQTPANRLDMLEQRLDFYRQTADGRIAQLLEQARGRLHYLTALAQERSPLGILARGYSLTTANDRTVSSIGAVQAGDRMTTRVRDGVIISTVHETKEQKDG